jgi:hypothetical protein
MFKGSLPMTVLSIIHEVFETWAVDDIYIACSGNFTIERDLRGKTFRHAPFRLHSNDVSIYTCAIGQLLSGGRPPEKVRDEYEDLKWLEPYMVTPSGSVATLMLATRLLEGWGKDNAYYKRLVAGYRSQWDVLYRKTVAKVEALRDVCRIDSFTPADAVDWMLQVPQDAGVACFPPFFVKGYEVMFQRLDDVFAWDPPKYPVMDAARRQLLFDRMAEKRHWIFGAHQRHPEFEEHLHGLSTTLRGVPVYIYANAPVNRIVRPRQHIEPALFPRLGPEAEIGGTMHLKKLTAGAFSALRSKYMNIDIRPALPTIAIGVFVDGHLIGCYAFMPPDGALNLQLSIPHVYMLSDFAVAPSAYDKLAKLVLKAALSRESQHIAEGMLGRRVQALVTTAFSRHHASMKYRGLFKAMNRKPIDDPADPMHGGFKVNYSAELGRWTLAEGLADWKKHHSSRRKGTHANRDEAA